MNGQMVLSHVDGVELFHEIPREVFNDLVAAWHRGSPITLEVEEGLIFTIAARAINSMEWEPDEHND